VLLDVRSITKARSGPVPPESPREATKLLLGVPWVSPRFSLSQASFIPLAETSKPSTLLALPASRASTTASDVGIYSTTGSSPFGHLVQDLL
jgi:hypothetical protein